MARRTRGNPNVTQRDGAGQYRRVPKGMSFVAGAADPLTRRVTGCLNSPNIAAAAVARDVCQRTIFAAPASSERWRIRVANRTLRNNTALTSPAAITGWWIGTPVLDNVSQANRRWSGDYAAAPTKVWDGGTVPVDGSDLVSPWITDLAKLFTEGAPVLHSWGATTAASGTGAATGDLQIAAVNTAGSSKAGDTVITSASGFASPFGGSALFDIRIEYEFVGTKQVGLFVGDSISFGTGDGDVTGTNRGPLAHEAWPASAAARGGYCAVNLSVPSGTITDAGSLATYWYTRADLATTVPDFAVIALGTNSIGAAISANRAGYLALIQAMRDLGIGRIYLCTLIPRGDMAYLQGALTADVAAGATSISSTVSVTSGTQILIGAGRKQELVTVSAAPTGTGPYTLTVPALANAHTVGEQVTSAFELNRQQLNDFARQMPGGVTAVLDMDDLMAASAGSAVPDPRMMSNDRVHPLRAGYQRMAGLAASLGSG
jgi:lysophospholipase L1-like esterase